jgi:hypothetical protein
MRFLKRTVILLGLHLVVLTGININAQTTDQEVAYLQTDRTTYISGETIYYKLYILDPVTKKRQDFSKVGYILLRSAGSNPSLKIRVKIDAGMSNGSIVLPDTLTSGAYQLVAFTGVMKNFGEQCFFHKGIIIVNRFDKELDFKTEKSIPTDSSLTEIPLTGQKIKTDKSVYNTREKVIVSLGKMKSKANVVVSVFEEPKIVFSYKSISETLHDFSGHLPERQPLKYYFPENTGKILRGRVIDLTTNKNVKSSTVLLSCMDSIANLQYDVTDSNGIFRMLLSNYYEGKELFLTIKDMPENQHWKIEIEDEFAQPEKWNPVLISEKSNSKEYMVKSQNIVYINKCYKLMNDTTDKNNPDNKIICPQLYNCPVSTVYPSDFVPLNDFQEIALELLPFVRINKEKGIYHVHVTSTSTDKLMADAAVFLDGIFVDDMNKVAVLGSEQIKKIEFIDAERTFGDLVFQGVVSITSKSNEMENTIPASQSLRIKNDKLNKNESFVSINSTLIQNKKTPLYKQLLYWNPDVEINDTDNTDFEFYTSDNIANYSIKVEGISDDGTPISLSSGFQVNNSINANDK